MDAGSELVLLGYPSDQGPGAGVRKSSGLYAGGGAHAGRGNFNANHNILPYGDFMHPITLGSGGGSTQYPGGRGGGAVHIIASHFTNHGSIYASGQDGTADDLGGSSGGGSGGSIWVECDYLASAGSWFFQGGVHGSMGRAALYYNSSSDSDFNNVPAGTTSVLGGGGTLYSEFGLKSKQKWLTGLGAPASLGWSDYFAATVLSVGKDFILDRIFTNGKLSFVDPTTRVDLTSTALLGSGTVFVGGELLVPSPSILSSTTLSFGVLRGGIATFSSTLRLTHSFFFCLGQLKGVRDVVLDGASYLYLSSDGFTSGNPVNSGIYNFTSVTLYGSTLQVGVPDKNTVNFGPVTISALQINLNGSSITASSQGYHIGKGPGAGSPSTSDGPPGGGGGHGGVGLKWTSNPQFINLPRNSTISHNYMDDFALPRRVWGGTYGSYKSPVNPGSGGGKFGYISDPKFIYDLDAPIPTSGCRGGGAIHLVTPSLMLNNSVINADGADILDVPYSNGCGAGAGGSIWIDARTTVVTGNYSITADGGGTSGGGGRIAIYGLRVSSTECSSLGLGGRIHALGGSPGTVFIDTTDGGCLVVQNNGNTPAIPGVYGSKDFTATVYLDQPELPTHKILIANCGSITFIPEPPTTFDPSKAANFVFNDFCSLLHWNGELTLLQSSPLTISISAHENSVVAVPADFVISSTLILDGSVVGNVNTLNIGSTGLMQLGPNGHSSSLPTSQYHFSFVTVSGQLVMCPDFDEAANLQVPHLIVDVLTIKNGGILHSNYLGYRGMRGPLPGLTSKSAGGHAGRGLSADYTLPNGDLLPTGYGDVVHPLSMGSGGAPCQPLLPSLPSVVPGGSGGGVVHVSFASSLTNYGIVSAVGQTTFKGTIIPPGAGGSIYMECTTSSCSITEQGSSYIVDGGVLPYYSSGGRISLNWPAIGLSARAGLGAAAGTIFIATQPLSKLFISGDSNIGSNPRPVTTISSAALGTSFYSYVFTLSYTSIEIMPGTTLDFSKVTLAGDGKHTFFISGNATFPNLDAKGYFVRQGGILNTRSDVVINNTVVEINGTISNMTSLTIGSGSVFSFRASANTAGYAVGRLAITNTISIYGEMKLYPYSGKGPTISAPTINIFDGGRLHADELGYGPGMGLSPGYIEPDTGRRVVAAYASSPGWSPGSPKSKLTSYGDVAVPVSLGSGGLAINGSGFGGGAFTIIGDTLQVNGTLSAKGAPYAAGGSIYVTVSSITGHGVIDVCGTKAVDAPRSNGRLAIDTTSAYSFNGNLICAGTFYQSVYSNAILYILPNYQPDDMAVDITSDSPGLMIVNDLFINASITVINRASLAIVTPNPNVWPGTLINYNYIQMRRVSFGTLINHGDVTVEHYVFDGTVINFGNLLGVYLEVSSSGKLYMEHEVDFLAGGKRPNTLLFHSLTVQGTVYIVGGKNLPVYKPLVSAYKLNITSSGRITADGQGQPTDRIGCFGGGGAVGMGGGALNDPPAGVDVQNPMSYGKAGGFCEALYSSPFRNSSGGGAIHIIAGHLLVAGNITADGEFGGGGGSVWLRVGNLEASPNTFLSAQGMAAGGYECGGGGQVTYTSGSGNVPSNVNAAACLSAAKEPSTGFSSGSQFPFLILDSIGFFYPLNFGIYFAALEEIDDSFTTVFSFSYLPDYFLVNTTSATFYSPPEYSLTSVNITASDSKHPNTVSWSVSFSAWSFAPNTTTILFPVGSNIYDWDAGSYLNYEIYTEAQNIQKFVTFNGTKIMINSLYVDGKEVPIKVQTYIHYAYIFIPIFEYQVQIEFGVPITTVTISVTHIFQTGSQPESPHQIGGSGFGDSPGAVSLGGDLIGPVVSWNDTVVIVIGPGVAKLGDFYLVTANGDTNVRLYYNTSKIIPVPSPTFQCYAWSAAHYMQYSTNKFNAQFASEITLSSGSAGVVQIRQTPCGASTCITAVAAQIGGTKYGCYQRSDGQRPAIYVNASLITILDNGGLNNVTVSSSATSHLVFIPPSRYVISSAQLTVEIVAGDGWLVLSTSTSETNTTGLCGNVYGGWTSPTPVHPISQSTIDTQVYSFTVLPADSLFMYFNESHDQYHPVRQPYRDYAFKPQPEANNSDCQPIVYLNRECSIAGEFFFSTCTYDVGRIGGSPDSSFVAYADICRRTNSSLTTQVVPSLSTAIGPGLGPIVTTNASTYFYIYFYDAFGNLLDAAHYIDGVESYTTTITYVSTGVVLVNYTASTPGELEISITVGDRRKHIRGSPFKVTIIETPSPNRCVVWGDPHLLTFSNSFDLQTFDEYILAKDDYIGYDVQIRLQPCGNGTSATGVAVKYLDTVLEIHSSASQIFLNNLPVTVPITSKNVSVTSPIKRQYLLQVVGIMEMSIRFYSQNLMDVILLLNYTDFAYGLCRPTMVPEFSVSKDRSIFNYNLTGTSWEEQHPSYTPNYNYSFYDDKLRDDATYMCASIFSGELAVCSIFISPAPFSKSCVDDAAVSGLKVSESSVATYARLVKIYACPFDTSNLPILGTLSDLEVDQLTITVRSPAQFTIIARNALGLPSSLPTNFSVHSDRDLTFPFTVVNNMNSTYSVSFTPDQPYSNLFIFVQNAYGVPVVGSPLIFNVQSGIENPCTVKNGRCDYRVSCNFTNGDIVCGPCPPGTYGQAAFGCNLYCGDGMCNSTYGENCVGCPQDCHDSSCGVCGDGYCDNQNEDCRGCFKDCGPCSLNRTCANACYGHGLCGADSLCVCKEPWAGPSCSVGSIAPANFTVNDTNPIVNVTIGSQKGATTKFFVSIKEISEISPGGSTLRRVDVTSVNFTLVTVESGLNKVNNYSAALENGARLNAIIWQFGEKSTPITFAGKTTNYVANTIKLSVTIQNWPFYNLGNSLNVVMSSGASDSAQKACVNENTDESGSLRWVLIVIDDVSLYGQFEDKAVVDGRIQKISYKLGSTNNTITAVLPHFWSQADMDPNFSVLIGDNTENGCGGNKGKKKNSNKLVLTVVIAVVVGLVVVASLLYFLLPRMRLWHKVRRQRVPTTESTNDPAEIEIERMANMEVTTASGRFVVPL